MLKLIRVPEKFPYTSEQLRGFEVGTMGRDLIEFVKQKGLELLPYYARHDMKHILLQYDTTDEGEVCLQCFMLGNGHLSFPVLATVAFGLATMPEHWKKFRIAFQRGRAATCIKHWNWLDILKQPTASLRDTIFSPQFQRL
jgi:ubiquinone biosynthesis protein Coq4